MTLYQQLQHIIVINNQIWQILLFTVLLSLPVHSAAQELPPCTSRPAFIRTPVMDASVGCVELVVADDDAGELAFTALAVAVDGTLYTTRPLTGEVFAITDSDDDGLPDEMRLIVSGLTLPNSLIYNEGALYIAGGAHIYRIDADGTLTTLVDDIPSGSGNWTGGIAIGDGRIYVGTGAPCHRCIPESDERGAILSYALDGSDRQIVARGFYAPNGLLYYDGALWVVDSGRTGLDVNSLVDELNIVTPGGHYGWPYCYGADIADETLNSDFDCSQTEVPIVTFPALSHPIALTPYRGTALPSLRDTLLVVMAGVVTDVEQVGFRVVAVNSSDDGDEVTARRVIPTMQHEAAFGTFQALNFQGNGFWPHSPLGVAVSPEGWVYVSIGGGRIIAVRPY